MKKEYLRPTITCYSVEYSNQLMSESQVDMGDGDPIHITDENPEEDWNKWSF